MAQLIAPFDPLAYDPRQGSGSLPVGRHKVIAESSELKPTKNNSGGYLQYNLRIVEGPCSGVTGPLRLNLYNGSEQAVNIANRQLSAICHVVGYYEKLLDSDVVLNKPFVVDVQPQKDNPQYTEVKNIFDANGNEPKPVAQAPAHSNQPQQQQPAMQGQSNPVGGFGSQAPQQPQGGQAAWGQPAQQQQQPQQQWQAPQQQQQPSAAGWQQQQPQSGPIAGNPAPWGQR